MNLMGKIIPIRHIILSFVLYIYKSFRVFIENFVIASLLINFSSNFVFVIFSS